MLPFGRQVWLVVRLEVAHAMLNQATDSIHLPPFQVTWIGPVSPHAHNGHDVGFAQPLAQLQGAAAAIVQQLHPLDVHRPQLVNPEVQL